MQQDMQMVAKLPHYMNPIPFLSEYYERAGLATDGSEAEAETR